MYFGWSSVMVAVTLVVCSYARCQQVDHQIQAPQCVFTDTVDPFNTQIVSPASIDQSLQQLTNVPVSLGGEWITDADSALSTYQAGIKFPILKVFGSPPPIVSVGFDYTNLETSPGLELPEDLFEYSIRISRVKRWNDRWLFQSSIGVGYATDNENRSSDSWQFRGTALAIYQQNPQWQWSFGAIALGRRDLPVIPAIGAVWTPDPLTRVDLILPNPKVNYLIGDDGERQQWIYFGGGFNGTTWGYESATLGDDVLTYRDWRMVAGWQSTPKAPPGVPFVRGRKIRLELGYVFSRNLEFDNDSTEVPLDDSFMLRWSTDY